MIGSWKIGAQLSTSHSFRNSLDPLSMAETVRRVQEEIDLDLLIVGFREAPGVVPEVSAVSDRPVGDAFLWYGALSDIEGMEDSDLVVNWRGERSRGWRGWAEKGSGVDETFRFVCPNNPAAREKTVRRLRELLARYDFTGVFLDKIRLPSPANGVDETLSCFCGHCRDAARTWVSTSTLSSKSSPMARSTPALRDPKQRETKPPRGSRSWSPATPSFRTSCAFALTASPRSSRRSPRTRAAWGGRFRSTYSRLASPPWSARTTAASSSTVTGRSP